MIVRGLSRRAAVFASVLLGGALLGTGLLGWVRAEGTSALDGRVPIEVVGSGAAPAVTAAGLAVLAAGVAALLVGTGGRFVVAAALGAAAVVVVATSLGVVSDPASVASSEAARLTGVPVLSAEATTTSAPWIAAALGVAAFLVAVAVLPGGRGWQRRSDRHERPSSPRPGEGPPADDDVAALWDEQSRERDAG